MWYQIKQYLKFLLRSTNQHGVHSPFVYHLVTKCFYDTTNFKDYTKIKAYKKELKKNKTVININDLGVGSRITQSNKRTISSIARNSGTTFKRAKLLYRLVKYFNSTSMLELGTSLGIGTQAMCLGNPLASVTTIEGSQNISKIAETNLNKQELLKIEYITKDFFKAIKTLTPNSYDLIFFDGNHNKEATLKYFNLLLPKANNNSIFIFDDIYWSKDMAEAWKLIIEHPKITVSIDTFFWGIVFFRTEQVKEHFTIRV